MKQQMKILMKALLYDNAAVMLTFALTNLFFLPISIFFFQFPMGVIWIICIIEGVLVSSIIMCNAVLTRNKDESIRVWSILSAYPVEKREYRCELYRQLFFMIGIQLLLTLAGLCMGALVQFKWEVFLAAFCAIFISMFSTGFMIISLGIKKNTP